jgi:prepilin-type N-terminal cleavage/methylation domain-containing protein
MPTHVRQARGDAGFTLPEMMISMGVMLVVLAGTFTAMTNAMRAEQSAKSITTMNGHLRSSMDLMTRDFLQVGQGLQTGRVITIPNGPGSTPIVRPGPAAAGACAGVTNFAVGPTLSAVTVGPDLGPAINGQCTDVINTLAVDGAFEDVNITSMAATGQSITIYPYGPDDIVGNADDVNISDVPDALGDNVRVGDLLEIRRGTLTATVYVTAVAGQTISFAPGDPLNLNQFDAADNMLGTTNQLQDPANVDPTHSPIAPIVVAGVEQRGPWSAFRIRLITYFVDTTTNPASPRLVRQMNGGTPNAVAFDLEAFRTTFDIADGVGNPATVRMDATDLGGGGACAPSPCSPNQIRKANVTLAIRSESKNQQSGYYHNTLFTQVALRSLAFVDRYN